MGGSSPWRRVATSRESSPVLPVASRLWVTLSRLSLARTLPSPRGSATSTPAPTNLGTGMRASVIIDLPGYTKEGLDALKKRCEELAVQPRGTRGESGGFDGCTYDVSNKHRLGHSEVALIQTMIDGVNTLWEEDKALQKKHGL